MVNAIINLQRQRFNYQFSFSQLASLSLNLTSETSVKKCKLNEYQKQFPFDDRLPET